MADLTPEERFFASKTAPFNRKIGKDNCKNDTYFLRPANSSPSLNKSQICEARQQGRQLANLRHTAQRWLTRQFCLKPDEGAGIF
jgi:hypothetical protein